MLGLNRVYQASGVATVLVLPVAGLWGQQVVVLDEIVAKVNQETITLTDLRQELDVLRVTLGFEIQNTETLNQEFENQRRLLLRDMIQNKMMLQRADELGISDDVDVDVAAALERMRKQAGVPNMEVMDQALRSQGTSLLEYRRNIKKRIIVDGLMQQSVYSKVTLLTPEIEGFYQENIDRYTEPAEVELKEILFLTEGKQVETQRKTAQEVLTRLRSGASFEDLAKKYSEGPTASRGGGIGSFKENSMAAAVEEVAFNLKEGEFSDTIETEYGLQIIKVVRRTPPRKKALEEVRPEILKQLYRKKAEPGVREFLEDLREQTYIYVAPKYREQFDLEGLFGSS